MITFNSNMSRNIMSLKEFLDSMRRSRGSSSLTEVEFKGMEMLNTIKTIKEVVDTVISDLFTVPDPEFEFLDVIMVDRFTEHLEPAVVDLVAPTEVDVEFLEVVLFFDGVAEAVEDFFVEVFVLVETQSHLSQLMHAKNLTESTKMIGLDVPMHIEVNSLVRVSLLVFEL